MKTLLVNNKKYRQSTQYMTEEIIEKLQSRGIEVLVDDGSQTISDQELDNIIVLGGDGTMLRAARTYGQGDLPILGINMGTVGFLSNIEINEVDGYLDQFLQGDYTIDTMMMLEVNIYEQGVLASTSYCLNEVVIKARIPNMITLNYRINEQPCVPYKGDGLIFATPAGSTAYLIRRRPHRRSGAGSHNNYPSSPLYLFRLRAKTSGDSSQQSDQGNTSPV